MSQRIPEGVCDGRHERTEYGWDGGGCPRKGERGKVNSKGLCPACAKWERRRRSTEMNKSSVERKEELALRVGLVKMLDLVGALQPILNEKEVQIIESIIQRHQLDLAGELECVPSEVAKFLNPGPAALKPRRQDFPSSQLGGSLLHEMGVSEETWWSDVLAARERNGKGLDQAVKEVNEKLHKQLNTRLEQKRDQGVLDIIKNKLLEPYGISQEDFNHKVMAEECLNSAPHLEIMEKVFRQMLHAAETAKSRAEDTKQWLSRIRNDFLPLLGMVEKDLDAELWSAQEEWKTKVSNPADVEYEALRQVRIDLEKRYMKKKRDDERAAQKKAEAEQQQAAAIAQEPMPSPATSPSTQGPETSSEEEFVL